MTDEIPLELKLNEEVDTVPFEDEPDFTQPPSHNVTEGVQDDGE